MMYQCAYNVEVLSGERVRVTAHFTLPEPCREPSIKFLSIAGGSISRTELEALRDLINYDLPHKKDRFISVED